MGINDWRNDGLKVVRAAATTGKGRATAFDFAATGGSKTWMGIVTLQPNGQTGAHHHGTHEVAAYVSKGRSRIRWGESLEFTADVGSGDFVYFAPNVPHQEVNLDHQEPLEFVVVRSDNSAIRIDLDIEPFEHPQTVYDDSIRGPTPRRPAERSPDATAAFVLEAGDDQSPSERSSPELGRAVTGRA